MIRMEAVVEVQNPDAIFRSIEKEISFALSREGARFLQLYLATVANWKTKPQFEMDVDIEHDQASVTVGTNNDIYRFLHDGTKERWALMSDDFEPKTHPRILGVGPGQGSVILRGRSQFGQRAAQPGIKAREWTQEIIKREEKNFQKNMQAAIDKAVGKVTGP